MYIKFLCTKFVQFLQTSIIPEIINFKHNTIGIIPIEKFK